LGYDPAPYRNLPRYLHAPINLAMPFELMTGSLTLPPIRPVNSFGQDAGLKR
jgi:hypothetical protein